MNKIINLIQCQTIHDIRKGNLESESLPSLRFVSTARPTLLALHVRKATSSTKAKPESQTSTPTTAMSAPRPLIICGPSGVGKGTIISLLTEENSPYFSPSHFGFSVSHTTRKPRPGEENGVHYHFVEKEDMKRQIERGEFVEFAEVHGNYYGTRLVMHCMFCFGSLTHCIAVWNVCRDG